MSQKKARVFSPEFKLKVVQRLLNGENISALARELSVLRKLLYEWKDAYRCGGAVALRTRGRPRKDQVPGLPPEATTVRAELLQARQRMRELERKVGQQQMELDFFVEALRRVDAALGEPSKKAAGLSTRSSESKRRKAD
jgi:transposase